MGIIDKRTLLWGALLGGGLVSCSSETVETGLTGIELTVEYSVAAQLDQIGYLGSMNSEILFEGRLPEPARPLQNGSDSLVILVSERLAGQTITLRVDGLLQRQILASEALSVQLRAAQLVSARVTLGEAAICGDSLVRAGIETCDDGNNLANDGCAPSCLTEEGFICSQPAGGPSICLSEVCEACDPQRSDGCDGDGRCTCGQLDSCGEGQRCAQGRCTCDETSCSGGCCENEQCVTPSMSACGASGGVCAACDDRADVCREGTCSCGDAPACAPGQACVAGLCVCTAKSCPAGCCAENLCEIRTVERCGVLGSTCATCSSTTADTCTAAGLCQCGVNSACMPGQRCSSGVCLCDVDSCPEGCCTADNECRALSTSSCGLPGLACADCSETADTCDAGACRCGEGVACEAGQRCVDGSCICDQRSCAGCCDGVSCLTGTTDAQCGTGGQICLACGANGPCLGGVCSGCAAVCAGCCNGPTCDAPSLQSCGLGGAACVACDPMRADACGASGTCECGGQAQCALGQFCSGGQCVCDPASCPGGCCLAEACVPSSFSSCGVSGEACISCDVVTADTCGAAGDCLCGGGPACDAGRACVGGTCQCTAASCPQGCCADGVCVLPDVSACGVGGGGCTNCDPILTDSCQNGQCTCGSSAACVSGQRCEQGVCVCDGASCTGCCRTNVCEPGTANNACGGAGVVCDVCTGQSICRADQTCGPACDASSCPAGCCRGASCEPGTAENACGMGGSACDNCTGQTVCRADRTCGPP